MLDEFLVKIRHRRNTSIVSLLMFLHNGQYPQSNDFFSYSTKHNIKITAKQIYEKLFVEPEPDPESPEVILQAQSEICEVIKRRPRLFEQDIDDISSFTNFRINTATRERIEDDGRKW